MSQKRHTVDQIITKLRRADVLLGKGMKVPEVCKQLEIAEQTYYRWRQKYGDMQPEMAKQFKALEKENARLKKMVAEQALDMDILKEAAKGNCQAPNGDGEHSLKCVVVWGQRKCRSVELAVCSVNRVARSVTNHYALMMNRSYSTRCVPLPDSVHALEQSVSTSY